MTTEAPFPLVDKRDFDKFFRALMQALDKPSGSYKAAAVGLRHFFTNGKSKPNAEELRAWVNYQAGTGDVPVFFVAWWETRKSRNASRVAEKLLARETAGVEAESETEAEMWEEEAAKLAKALREEQARRREAEDALAESRENVSAQHRTIEALREKAEAADKAAAEASVRAARPVADSAEAKRLRKDLEEERQRGNRWEQEAEALQGQLRALREQARDERERCETDVRRARERADAAEARAKAAETMAMKGSQQPSRIESIRIAIETLTRVADALGS